MSILKGEYEVIMTRYEKYEEEIELEVVDRWEVVTVWETTIYSDDLFDAINEITSQYNITKITTKEA